MTKVSEYARICKDTHVTGENITYFDIISTIHNTDTNFDARLYKSGNEIVICFQASQEGDNLNNVQILAGLLGIDGTITIPTQLKDALELYFKTKQDNPNANITLTGHSFGGALAQLVSYITGEDCISFSTPGLKYTVQMINAEFLLNNSIYKEILDKYNIDSSQFVFSGNNIVDYSNMNDPVGCIGENIGEQFLLEPNPIQIGESVTYSPHENIEIFFNDENIDNAQKISEWSINEAGALFCFDSNYSGVNLLYSFLKTKYSIDENDLKTAIEIIREKIQEPLKYLSYTTKNGTYIIDSKESSHVINASENDSDTDGNDIVFANSGSDIVNGFSGNDILIGGSGADTLFGGDNNDVLIAGDAKGIKIEVLEKLLENKTNITSVTQYETENLETNIIYGDSGDDLLIGDIGNDLIISLMGNDTIISKRGEKKVA